MFGYRKCWNVISGDCHRHRIVPKYALYTYGDGCHTRSAPLMFCFSQSRLSHRLGENIYCISVVEPYRSSTTATTTLYGIDERGLVCMHNSIDDNKNHNNNNNNNILLGGGRVINVLRCVGALTLPLFLRGLGILWP